MSELIDRMCAEATARLKHWIGTKVGIAKAKVAENGYQQAYADMQAEARVKYNRKTIEAIEAMQREHDVISTTPRWRGSQYEHPVYGARYHEPFINKEQP